ncbi:MAG: MFS transporter [Chloroflexi bacterium]|nr:MFS transporter [Chloroflexota bacterium]
MAIKFSLPYRVALVSLLTNLAFELSFLFLPLFAETLGASTFEVGLVGGAYGIAFFVSSLVFGRQSDIKGRLFFVRLGLGLGAAALATQALVGGTLTLILSRALVGLCLGISSAALLAYNFEIGAGTGRFASFGSLGMLLGDAVAIYFRDYRGLFILSSVFCTLAFVASWTLREGERRIPVLTTTAQVARRNVRVYLAFFLRHLGASMVWAVFPLFLTTLGATTAWVAILAGINTGGQFIAMLLADKLKGSRLFFLGLFLSAVVFVAYSLATGYLQVIPVQVALAAAWSFLYVGALVMLLQSNEERATSVGVLFSVMSISSAVGPFLGGAVAEFWGYRPLMYVAAGLSSAGLAAAVARRRSRTDQVG